MELAITRDKKRLEELEGVIQRNLQSFYEVGRALMEIRDRELYKVKNGGAYGTFEAYCRGAWDFNRAHAYRLMDSAKVIETLSPVGDISPVNERQLRPLTRLNDDPEKQRVAWQRAVETAPEGKVTAAHVQKVVREMVEPERKEPKPKQQEIKVQFTNAMMIAGFVISHLERIMDSDPERDNALSRVADWIAAKRRRTK
jgi:hypothetical protein